MTLSRGLRRLATVVDDLDTDNIDVLDASITDHPDLDGAHHVTLELAFADGMADTVSNTNGADSQGSSRGQSHSQRRNHKQTQVDISENGNGNENENGNESENRHKPDHGTGNTDDDGDGHEPTTDIECPEPGCSKTFDSEPGMKIHRTKVHLSNTSAEADSNVPAYRDPDVLSEVYEAHDTFPEMRDALGADVSVQTIRRHMIKHGIHDSMAESTDTSEQRDTDTPNETSKQDSVDELHDTGEQRSTNASNTKTETEAEPTTQTEAETARIDITDGSSLTDADVVPPDVTIPEELTLQRLRDTVDGADTLYDVQQEFDLDREAARKLLRAFDLLELVHGRVATKRQRDELKNEIDKRIKENIHDQISA